MFEYDENMRFTFINGAVKVIQATMHRLDDLLQIATPLFRRRDPLCGMVGVLASCSMKRRKTGCRGIDQLWLKVEPSIHVRDTQRLRLVNSQAEGCWKQGDRLCEGLVDRWLRSETVM